MNHYNQSVKIIPLGGSGSVTKNMYVYEYQNQIMIIDCGIGFPESSMLGADLLIPDISYLENKMEQIKGIVITHGHEDHYGGLPYILPALPENLPIYGTALTLGLIEEKMKEFNQSANTHLIDPDTILKIGPFELGFVRMTHSIPDTLNIAITTPNGRIYHGSDFKFDWTPVWGQPSEVNKIARFAGSSGVDLLMSDCVRVNRPGHTLSEQVIEDSFEHEIRKTQGRFIVTTISSNITRIQQAIDVSYRHGRRVAIIGRSINRSVEVATRLRYINIPRGCLIDSRVAKKLKPHDLTLIVAGSQAQVGSSLVRMADGSHSDYTIQPTDTVIFSSDPIPGNELAIYKLIDQLTLIGAHVLYTEITDDLHVSGHGAQGDIALMIALNKPKYLFPIGGQYHHLRQYQILAENMGYPKESTFILVNGETLALHPDGTVTRGEKINLRTIIIDGSGIGDVGNQVLSDRQTMSQSGIVVVVVPTKNGQPTTGQVRMVTRGFVFVKHSGKLIKQAETLASQFVRANFPAQKQNPAKVWPETKKKLKKKLQDFFNLETKRQPLIIIAQIELG